MRIILLFILGICIVPIYSQWQVVGPAPIYESLRKPYFIEPEIGFVCAGKGFLYKSTDGFITFEKIYTGAAGDVRQLQFTDDSMGYLIMSENLNYGVDLLKTSDAGITWYKISDSLIEFPMDLSFINRTTGYITTKDHLLFTSDAGFNWEIRNAVTGRIWFINSLKGFRIDTEKIYKTSDGGINWQLINFPDMKIINMAFHDEMRIVLLGKHNITFNNKIILTSDGGITWIEKPLPNSILENDEILFQDSTIILMSINATRSDDLGNTWTYISSSQIPDVSFTSTYCLKDKYYRFGLGGAAISSVDSGKTWKNLGSRHGGSKIIFTDSLNGSTAPWYLTTNGGGTWQYREVALPENIWLYDYHFFTPEKGLLSTRKFIFKTTDSGSNWDTIFTAESFEICQEIYFSDSANGFALMSRHDGTQVWESGIRKTTDGGGVWSNFIKIPIYEPEDLYFPTANLGFIRNRLFNNSCRSSDGGLTWQYSDAGYGSIHLYDSLNGYANINQSLFKTTDGGFIFFQVSLQIPGWKIYFIDSLNGWCTTSWDIYFTQDGGLNWQLEYTSRYLIREFKFINNTLFAAGDHGTLLKRTGFSAVDAEESLPQQISLDQNYPNPFNPTTIIRYSIPSGTHVVLIIYDILGREAARLVSEEQPAGQYEVNWNADAYPSGVYICLLNAGSNKRAMKMTLIK
jgi:photosystem II stability/assembly factor-like uncharacterized protein